MSRAVLPPSFDRWHPVKVALSVATLAALVVGVPVVLVAVGGPPFLHGGLTGIQRSFTTGHSGDARVAAGWIAMVALALAWSLWVWMTLCVAIELRSWVTGRPPARLPVSRTAQSLAAFLVGTTLAVTAVGRGVTVPNQGAVPPSSKSATSGAADGAAGGIVPIADLLAGAGATRPSARPSIGRPPETTVLAPPAITSDAEHELPRSPSGPERRTGPSGTAAGPVGHTTTRAPGDRPVVPRTHLVCSRETLWSIAEAELGAALRWYELAQLNYGITQEDGRALDEGHWIRPGWRLLLPPDGPVPVTGTRTGPKPEPDPSTAMPMPTFTVGDVRSGGSAGVLEPPPPGPANAAFNLDADSVPESDPSGPYPGARGPAPQPVRSPSFPVVPLGAGVVGAGVARLIDRLRQVQQRYRAEGGLIQLPDGKGNQFEWRLRIGDGWGLLGEVDAAIRICSRSDLGQRAEPLRLLGVRVHPEVIELVPCAGGGPAIVVDRATLASSPSHQDAPPPLGTPSLGDLRAVAPLLVTVGRGPSGPVMVNLESVGSLVVSGNPDAADAVVRALALELATSFWSGQFSLAVVGFGSELERFDGVTYYPEVSDLVHTLCCRRIAAATQVEATGYSSFAQARQAETSERWAPLVVICGPAVVEADVGELLEVAADPVHGTAVVAVGERVEAEYSVRIEGGDGIHGIASLERLAEMVVPQRVEFDELDELTALLETASSRQSALRSEEPYVNLPIRMPQAADTGLGPSLPADDAVSDQAPDPVVPTDHKRGPADHQRVEVAVLGPVEVRGAARPFTRAWAEELVVYLAMHANGASNDAWATALWPDRLMAPSSLHSIASVARRSLGQGADGTDHLPRSHGRLALAPTVSTDWDRFVALADSDSTEQWHAALTLIRGRPFEGLRASDWPILEGIAPAMEAAVVDLSGRLAGAYLKLGDARGAEWAARRGLVVSPYDERLYRMLMRASDLAGNPAGVEALMRELLTLVAEGLEPLDAVHPSTMELYRQLSRRKGFGASGR